jgi:photosystem II stability/assembly factor-like uncharacterized protein
MKTISIGERAATHRNGTSYLIGVDWSCPVFPADLVPENRGVFEVHFFNDTHGFAIGGNHYGMYDLDYLGYIISTSDGGVTWTDRFRDETRFTFTDIECFNTVCYVTALGLGNTASQHLGIVMKSTDFGVTWRQVLLITGSATSYAHLWHAHFLSETYGVVQGDYWGGLLVFYVTEDGGASWKIAFDPNCQDRHYVHDNFSFEGSFRYLVQEPDVMQTGFIRLDRPTAADAIRV